MTHEIHSHNVRIEPTPPYSALSGYVVTCEECGTLGTYSEPRDAQRTLNVHISPR